jgi:hypothetical protein
MTGAPINNKWLMWLFFGLSMVSFLLALILFIVQ